MSDLVSFTYRYPRPAVTVDVVAVRGPAHSPEVLLIRRARAPFKGAWALPGGFVGIDEDLPDAARRELFEETGIRARCLVELGVFGRPDRDPRGRVISVAYLARLARPDIARAGDDASSAEWFPMKKLPKKLAFDHAEILARARKALMGPWPAALRVGRT